MLELLAKLADVAFHDVLVDVFIEDPVNGVEDLGLREPAAAIANEAFEDPALAAREGQGLAAHFSLASVEIDFEVADRDVAVFAHDAAADRADASEDLADMDGCAEHGIDAGGRELLRFAALLHDVGSGIGYDGHAEHSRYVIQYGNLRGLSEAEVEIIANVARYHGKRLGEVQVAGVLFDMMGILRRHRVRANATFTLVNIAIAVTEGIGKQLDPEVDLMGEALPFFVAMQAGQAAARAEV